MDVLAVGAHQDDIEIGAGVLIHRLAQKADVWFLILTDDGRDGWRRRSESLKGARVLGVPAERVLFGGLRESYLRADGDSVATVRRLTEHLRPVAVVTHTSADSHNDHAEAERIARASFRACTFLHFPVYLSAEPGRFWPSVTVPLRGGDAGMKSAALAAHASQADRLARGDLAGFEKRLGGGDRSEAFEVTAQEGADPAALALLGLG